VHLPSQLILKVITSPSQPTPDEYHAFHEASIIVLSRYYMLYKKSRLKWVLVTVGELMDACPSFREQLSNGKQSKTKLIQIRYRKEQTPPPPEDRESTIRDWITANAEADHHALSDKFCTGTLVAKAYLNKYRCNLL
jgi:hypothetical protein